jgi:hypothetical protein
MAESSIGEEFMKLLLLCILFSMLLTSSCSDVEPPPSPKRKVVLIFSDVTSSLLKSENTSVANLTADVIDSLPPGSKFSVVPIQVQPERLTPMNEGIIAPRQERDEDVQEDIKQYRRQRIKDSIDKLYKKIRELKVPAPLYGSPDNHSCVLGTLAYAESYFRQFPDADLELIYISDMIEECNETPFGRPVNLAQQDITKEIKDAQSFQIRYELGRARLSVIIPTSDDTPTAGMRPGLSNVKQFWEKVFMNCGFNQDALQSNDRFYFKAGLPDRFKPPGR